MLAQLLLSHMILENRERVFKGTRLLEEQSPQQNLIVCVEGR